jgi:hypothetical protein
MSFSEGLPSSGFGLASVSWVKSIAAFNSFIDSSGLEATLRLTGAHAIAIFA